MLHQNLRAPIDSFSRDCLQPRPAARAHYLLGMTVLDRPVILPDIFVRWFASRGWTPRAHQLDLLAKARTGRSVLLIAPTGGGKTLAGFLPSLVELSGTSISLPAQSGGV